MFSQVAEGLRAILNAGHRRGAVVSRCGDQKTGFQLKDFQVFCPKAIAAIGELPGTIADRSIPIRLRRRTRGETVERFRLRDAQAAAAPLQQALGAWAPTAVELRAARPVVPEALNDRAAEGWESLFAIADLAGGEWPERARAAALALHAHGRDEDSLGVQLSPMRVVIRGDAEHRVNLAIPPAPTIVAQLCRSSAANDSGGLLLGHVRDAETQQPRVGTVTLLWMELLSTPGTEWFAQAIMTKSSTWALVPLTSC